MLLDRTNTRRRRPDLCDIAWPPAVSSRALSPAATAEDQFIRDWLGSLSDSDYKRVDEVAGLLAEKGAGLGGPWSDHLGGQVWELRVRLAQVAVRVTYWCRPDGTIVMLTVFRKTRQHDQRQIDRAVRAQQACARDHRWSAEHIYERQA